jgi:hypothetical protein
VNRDCARLAELQSRIRPHFLCNAFNTALALVRVDPGRAEDVLEDLAALLRMALAEVGASVTLGEEIELARRCLAIETIRFGGRLDLALDSDPRARGVPAVPCGARRPAGGRPPADSRPPRAGSHAAGEPARGGRSPSRLNPCCAAPPQCR